MRAHDEARLKELENAATTSGQTLLDLVHTTRPQMFAGMYMPGTAGSPDNDNHFSAPSPSGSGLAIGQYDELLISTFMDPAIDDSVAKCQRLKEFYDTMLLQAEHKAEFGQEDSDNDFDLADTIGNLGIFVITLHSI